MPITAPEPVKAKSPQPTFFLFFLLFVSTLGPLQFGYHLVSCKASVTLSAL